LPRKKLLNLAVAAAVGCATVAFAAPAMASTTINGAGSTLVAPLEGEWATAFASKTGDSVNYQAVGSGTGISDIIGHLVDFGASDAPLNSTQASQCSDCVVVPWAVSATGVGYNLPGIHRLRLNAAALSGIYLGQITKWNDSRITRLNKGEHFPNLTITPIFRTDGSGDTYAFTNYLSHVNRTWASKYGKGTQVTFPASHGAGGKGNSGVTSLMESTQGSIAYIAVSYLFARRLPAASLLNRAGHWEKPNLASIQNAANSVHGIGSNGVSIVDPPKSARIAYPISTFTYAIVHSNVSSVVKQFIKFAVSPSGQQFGPGLDFAALPTVVVNAARAALNRIH
jgi:phosphate transport system substrate-binding protein